MTTPTDAEVIRAMRKFGGSFVQALAIAARSADPENMRRLKEAWPEYWMQYTAFAAMENAKEQLEAKA